MTSKEYLHDLSAVLKVGERPHHVLVDQLDRVLPVTVEAANQLSHFPCTTTTLQLYHLYHRHSTCSPVSLSLQLLLA